MMRLQTTSLAWLMENFVEGSRVRLRTYSSQRVNVNL